MSTIVQPPQDNGVATAAEIDAALAAAASENIPSLDDGAAYVPVSANEAPKLRPLPPRQQAPAAARAAAAVDEDGPAAQAQGARRRAPLAIGDFAYRVAERMLMILNAPLAGASAGIRTLVGLCAAASIVVTVLAKVILPLALPAPDPLAEMRAAVAQSAAPPQAADDAASGKSGH